VTKIEQLIHDAASALRGVARDPKALAEAFCEMDSDGQAAFLAATAKTLRSWPGPGGQLQASYIGAAVRKLQSEVDAAMVVRLLHEMLEAAK
jgi:uncharacterized phage protein gp47/JayE